MNDQMQSLERCAALHSERFELTKTTHPKLASDHAAFSVAIRWALDKLARKKEPRKPFNVPESEDWMDYAQEIALCYDQAQMAWDHYQSNGWKVGSNHLKCWKSALRNWRRRWAEEKPEAARLMRPATTPKQDDDPQDWRDFLLFNNYPYAKFLAAPDYMRSEFNARNATKATR